MAQVRRSLPGNWLYFPSLLGRTLGRPPSFGQVTRMNFRPYTSLRHMRLYSPSVGCLIASDALINPPGLSASLLTVCPVYLPYIRCAAWGPHLATPVPPYCLVWPSILGPRCGFRGPCPSIVGKRLWVVSGYHTVWRHLGAVTPY